MTIVCMCVYVCTCIKQYISKRNTLIKISKLFFSNNNYTIYLWEIMKRKKKAMVLLFPIYGLFFSRTVTQFPVANCATVVEMVTWRYYQSSFYDTGWSIVWNVWCSRAQNIDGAKNQWIYMWTKMKKFITRPSSSRSLP